MGGREGPGKGVGWWVAGQPKAYIIVAQSVCETISQLLSEKDQH